MFVQQSIGGNCFSCNLRQGLELAPKPKMPSASQVLRPRLDEQIDLAHPLARLAGLIDWEDIERSFGAHFVSTRGRPALPPRLVAGLLYLQHTFAASDEAVVNT